MALSGPRWLKPGTRTMPGWTRALELYLPLARTGDITAQSRLARIYTRNRGVPVNETESCNWWQAA
ncbi:MAG: hypothetical protein ACK4XK_12310, partial [Casimicrobiaceae bacterium]